MVKTVIQTLQRLLALLAVTGALSQGAEAPTPAELPLPGPSATVQEAQFPQHEEHPVFFPGKTFLTHTHSKATTKARTMISAKFIIDTSILTI